VVLLGREGEGTVTRWYEIEVPGERLEMRLSMPLPHGG
jgi:hypothetical protein